jgi:acyl-CoA reductase-like NAD-dependent aldehyde dehydrogenase
MLEYEAAELTTHLFIDGDWCRSSERKTLPIFNPARPDELVGHIASATPRDVERAWLLTRHFQVGRL